ncbi:hypothetical protein GIB67_031134 [Kingdonia uniflora]|uniref:Uncharacterized protein n=1 Tax=Kingdonia uniflora TaxID=39325 RepID=A0A7J7MEF1_9MAGN|nr:hypothetical protein GIB67_031134 [Kingdonia uniflora]
MHFYTGNGFTSKTPTSTSATSDSIVCLTIGAYSKWLDTSPSGFLVLPSVIDILMSGMSASEDSAAAAALAFRHICDDCRKKLCGSLEGLFHVYHKAVNGESDYKISAEESLYLVEALSMVITELPLDHAKKALEALCLPVVSPLQVLSSVAKFLYRYVNHPEAVADAIQRLWPIFKPIFDHNKQSGLFQVRTSGRFMGTTIGVMLEEIQGLYPQHHQPCFLYLSSEVIKIFGSDQSCTNYLRSLIEALFTHTTHLLTTIQDFTARPDIADDCFLLASRCIRYCPHIFVPSAVFSSLVDCAMIGITIQHREACTSILTFLSDVLDLANSTLGKEYLSIRDNVIVPRGPSLTRILIASLTGALPSSRLEVITYTLLALTRAYGMKALEWARESISLLPSTAVTDLERSRFLQALSEAATGANISSLIVPVEELSDVCRRNRGVQEIVQGALKPLELNFVPVY